MNITGYLTYNGFIIQDNLLRRKLGAGYDKFLESLTIRTPQKIGPELTGRAYKHDMIGGIRCIFLPRTLISVFLNQHIIDEFVNLLAPVPAREYKFICELFGNQRVIVDWFTQNVFCADRVKTGNAIGVLNLRAGMGKTFVAAGMIAALRARALYIVPKRPLLVQAIRELKLCFDGANIGKYTSTIYKKDKHKNVDEQDITVIIINSALDRPKEFFAKYDLIIMDEIHSFASPERQSIFWRAQSKYIFGMSATTADRSDKFDFVYYKHMGAVVMAESIPGFTYEAVTFDCTLRAIWYKGPPEHTKVLNGPTGMMAPYLMARQFLKDPYRNQLVVKIIREFYEWRDGDKKHYIYVFAEELKPLEELLELLRKELPPDELANFVGGIKDDKIEEIRVNSRVILTTYRYGGTGVSFEQMTVSVFLTSRKANMLQILARILRRNGDRSIPRYFVDIIDARTPMRRQFNARQPAYEFYGAKNVRQDIDYTDVQQGTMPAIIYTPAPLDDSDSDDDSDDEAPAKPSKKKIEMAHLQYIDYLNAIS
jgi:hypothetical protein